MRLCAVNRRICLCPDFPRKGYPAIQGRVGVWRSGNHTVQRQGQRHDYPVRYRIPFTYTVEKNALHLHFDNAYISDASYTFTVEDGTLTLSGGKGTTGGTYALTKTPEPGREDK